MADQDNTQDGTAGTDTEALDNTVQALQKATDEAEKQGFYGTSTDPTPRENYSVAGVTSGKPTPETDEKAAQKAADANR